MKKLFSIFLFLGLYAFPCSDLLDTEVKILNEKEFKNLCEYEDHTILVVNTASNAVLHINMNSLRSLQRRFRDEKFTVLGFPSRNFMGQEFSDEEKVSEFCKINFLMSLFHYFQLPM